MYDFESVSVSSFEAASLAATLTEKSADGWEVVAIVPAGSDVVAYLRRSRDGGGMATVDAQTSITDGTSNTVMVSDTAADLLTPTSVSSEPSVASSADAGEDSSRPPAAADSGGAGWAAGGDTSSASSTTSGWTSGDSAAEPSSTTTSSWSGSAQQQAPTPTPSVPAGWYADPSGRYELRYWDGTGWTEHVSRGGQQFTDPPVA